MAERNLDLAMRVSADAREGIDAFRALKKSTVETSKEFAAATARVSELAREMAAAEKPSAKLKREFDAAKREAAGLKDALQQQEQRLNSSRQALTQAGVNVKDLAAEYRRLKADAAAAGVAQAEAARQAAAAASQAAAAQARSGRLNAIGAAVDGNKQGALDTLGVRSSQSVQAEITKVQQAMQRLAGDSRVSGAEFDRAFAAGGKRIAELRGQLDPTTAAVARMTGGVGDLNTQLGPLQGALAAVAAALSAQRILTMAEEYQQYTARLRLATQYTGDFLEVQAALRDVARDARAPIAETVNLYSRLGPSLNAMGRNGQQAAAVVLTVTKSIALSGASAAASEASLVQFGQAMDRAYCAARSSTPFWNRRPRWPMPSPRGWAARAASSSAWASRVCSRPRLWLPPSRRSQAVSVATLPSYRRRWGKASSCCATKPWSWWAASIAHSAPRMPWPRESR